MPYPAALELPQWAREAVKGTDLAATSKMQIENFSAKPEDGRAVPKMLKGLMVRNRGNETVVKRWSSWTASGPVTYEQLQNWLSMMVKGAVVGVGTAPTVWTFARTLTADPGLDSFTLERRETDGSTPVDHAWHYCMGQKLVISGADGELLMMEAEGFGRVVKVETITPALTGPTLELPPAVLVKVYIDSTWANLGTTLVSTQVLDFSVEFNTGAMPKWTMDARSDMDFTTHVYNADNISVAATLTLLLGAQFTTEKAAAEAQTLRAIRIQVDGTSGRQLQIDFLAKYAAPGLFEFGDDGDGQKTVTLTLEDANDGTNVIQYKLSNAITTLV